MNLLEELRRSLCVDSLCVDSLGVGGCHCIP
jgi:hypothetical protein